MSEGRTIKLQVRNLNKWFSSRGGGDLHVLADVNLDVYDGEFVSIVGASGCGKSTFLRIVDGLISAEVGELFLDGRRITKPGPDRSIVFQQDSLYPWRTAEENIRFGLEIQNIQQEELRSRCDRLIRLVGLDKFAKQYPHELSGGMRQRVNLARALAVQPQVLLMDEPFASLDAQTRELMQRELLKIWESQRATVIFVTHQIEEALYLSDRVVVFSSRPGSIKEIVDVPFSRPRDLSIKRQPEFVSRVDRIWKLIEEEVEAALRE